MNAGTLIEYLYRPRFSWFVVFLIVLCAGAAIWMAQDVVDLFDWFNVGISGIAAVLLLYVTLLSRYGKNLLQVTADEILIPVPFTGATKRVAIAEIKNIHIRTQEIGKTAWFSLARQRWLDIDHASGKLNVPEQYLPCDSDLDQLHQLLNEHMNRRPNTSR